MKTPTVSVVLSVFNGLQYLPSAVESILSQTYSDFEFIIIDDGSTDGASGYLDTVSAGDQRVQVIHQENRGLGASLNRGCLLAKGKYIARMDGDDISAPERLDLQVNYMENRPDVAMSTTGALYFDDEEKFIYHIHQMPDDHTRLIAMLESGENPFVHGTVIMRIEFYRGLKEGYRLPSAAQDFDLWLRMSNSGRFGVLQQVVYGYRVCAGSAGFGVLAEKSKLASVIIQLHEERKKKGKEISNWKELTSSEQGYAKRYAANSLQKDEVGKYIRALHWLSVGKYKEFYIRMKVVAAGSSAYSKKAKIRIILYPFTAFLWRVFYHWQKKRTLTGKWIKKVTPGNKIPEFILRELLKN